TEKRHQELLELISCQSASFASTSSIGGSSFNASSDSFSLLPASPPIFHGRESELESLVDTLVAQPASVAILGPGGIGKTTLAMAILHHHSAKEKYPSRHFISCESASTCDDLLASIGSYLGLELSGQLSRAILSHLRRSEPCLLMLDNFETPWERPESRSQVEELLSSLSAIPSLALLITMRGAERPGKVKWHRPFLPPLEPLSSCASRKIFLDIAEEPDSEEESALNDLLDLSGSLPLAVSLMANIASFEGYSGTLRRWRIENTTLLSDGHHKRSNLEKSIILSLGSPRMASSPHAKDLLSLLSLLPDGIRAEDIMASNVPIPNVRRWQSVLIGTSLAYIDAKGHLKALSPIREYIRRVYPAARALSNPLRTYFQDLIELWGSKRELPSSDLTPALVAFLGNINQLLLDGLLSAEKSTRIEIGYTIIILDSFSATMLKGGSTLFQRIPRLIEETGDAGLRWKYIGRCIGNPGLSRLIENVDAVVEEGIQYFTTGNHTPSQVVRFYRSAALHYRQRGSLHKAIQLTQLGLSLAQKANDTELQLISLQTEFYI
ncbi:P-loop containing nucleoside triphosphate hydrolase protein, partial [Mycena olivaceomarginata]